MRKISTTKTRSSWRHRAAQRYKKTPTEKALLKAKRKQHRTEYTEALAAARNVVMEQATLLREKFGRHSVNYYFEEIMQRSRIRKGTRKANKWNAFVKKQVELHNAALPAGEKRHKACELMSEIRARWQELDEDQRTIETHDVIEILTERREMKELATHNTMVHAFNDAQRTLEKIDRELTALHSRTGVEFILLGVRGDTEHWNQPHVFHTARAAEFFDCCFKTSIGTLAFRFEGYCIAGVQEAAAAPAHAQHMYYTNFDTNITAKYRVVLEKWPLSKFCCPGDINGEFEDWENGRFDDRMAEMLRDDENVTSAPPTQSPSPPSTETPTMSTSDLSEMQSGKRPADDLNGVFSVSGEAMPVQKRARKERSDKGKKRGPRKRNSASTSIPSSDPSATLT
ncbi:hypothetical protein EV424DRAFT_1472053 [Suillus variegatus]|nr:hypothetical protein EV424DRAFT_1472053 [Suillus variegatus]